EKRSNEVWQVLGAVKSEFETFEKVLTATQKHMKQAEEDLEKLVGTRTRAITKKLRSVEALPTDNGTANLIDMS
ncbi:MAG: DNA recombination protein RmuC, partial [Ruminiclostridium sp.]|nr:DNA recombination protein RmuC [Ruminiclostridium sp.]